VPDALDAVSPLDGRYADRMTPLRDHASEAALMRARVRVEVEYLVALAVLDATPLTLDEGDRAALRDLVATFDAEDAARIKRIETEGTDDRPATNHDVKAVEYFVRDALTDRGRADATPWVHFALTSEDVTNLAYRLLVRGAVREVLRPALDDVRGHLRAMADDARDVPMLARTHGQPATPTTFGKELAVFADRLDGAIDRLDAAEDALAGKLGGASGTYAAHVAAYPGVDWPAFAAEFVAGLGFDHAPLTTQVNPGDDLAALFDALRAANAVLVDLDRDAWRYVSDGYLVQDAAAGETGSSTMPHKVNPIDFENSEGNLSKADADLEFLAGQVRESRLQRDLSDSTVKRTIGTAFGHCLLGYTKCADGLGTVAPDPDAMRADLEAHPEVIGEAVQTILRREGHEDAYERVKALTRDRTVTIDDFHDLFDDLDVPPDVRAELRALTPADYTGVASKLVDDLDT
jgi:adenylosuccinate lyase